MNVLALMSSPRRRGLNARPAASTAGGRLRLGLSALVATAGVLVQPLGGEPALAATAPGRVLAWGSDGFSQLGDGGTNVDRPTPAAVTGSAVASNVIAVAAGGGHSLALRSDGSVHAWGWDSAGQLGDGGTNTNQGAPIAVSGLGPGSGVVAVAAGGYHSLALRSDGSVVAWGSDSNGQLGDGAVLADRSAPVAVSGLGAGSGVIAVSAGFYHSLALRSDGSVVAWGSDSDGQLGDNAGLADQPAPVTVSGLGPGSGTTGISAGGYHSLAVRSNGHVLAWGSDSDGQLGDGGANSDAPTPVTVSGLGAGSGVASVIGGGYHSLALRSDGSVLAWGFDGSGQLGDGGADADQPAPVAVSGLGAGSGVISLAGGVEQSLALRSDGSVVAWGWDGFGQLGDGGANTNRAVPTPVSGLGFGSGTVAIAAGFYHSLATTTAPPGGPTYAPLSPARVLDTRFGPGTTGPIGPGQTRNVTVAGVGGVPATGVTAVVLNVTAVGATASTYVTAWPTGEARPLASNLNVPPGDTRANLVIVKVGASGQVSFSNDAGTIDLLADVAGYYGPNGGQRYTPVSPVRLWDSRGGPGPVGRVGTGQVQSIPVTGLAGVPANGVTAVALNVTAVGATASTYVTAWSSGETRPLASNLNVPPGDTRPNLVIVKVGAGGQVSFFNDAGNIDLLVDVAGYYGAGGASFTSVSPYRAWDSRSGPGPIGSLPTAGTRDVTVTGLGGVPATGVSAVILNVTAVNPTAGTFVTVWPTGEAKPLASNLNVPPGDTRANLVIVKVGAGGQVSFYNDAGTIDLIADVAGWYGTGT
jgi:alpha-tubulin suppressor-like RCC1 family protein